MARSARPRASDLRAVARLSHECRDLGDDAAAWRRHLVRGLDRLVGASLAQTGDGRLTPAGGAAGEFLYLGVEAGDPAALRCMAEQLARSAYYNPIFGPYLREQARENGVCRTRPELVADAAWYGSAYFELHRALGADATLYCNWLLPTGETSVLALGRPVGEPDFSDRQKAVVAAAHALVAPLIGGPLARFSDPSPSALPPRARQVLRCLLDGDGDKLIAARLGVTRAAVNQHVKRIFRHFGVASRAELLACWVRRGWGNGFARTDSD